MHLLVALFSHIMDACYAVVPNHWVDIILFTFVTKILQLPLSLWCHRNSLTMVSLMPETNRLKAKYFGDNERIGEESAALFKREHYHPLLSLVPLGVQIVILMGFVTAILNLREGGDSWREGRRHLQGRSGAFRGLKRRFWKNGATPRLAAHDVRGSGKDAPSAFFGPPRGFGGAS